MKGAVLFLFVIFFLGCGSTGNGDAGNDAGTTRPVVSGPAASGISAADGPAHAVADDDRFAVIDGFDPAEPALTGTCRLSSGIDKICEEGGLAYLASGERLETGAAFHPHKRSAPH